MLDVLAQDLRLAREILARSPNPVLRVTSEGVLLYANVASQPVLAAWQVAVGQVIPPAWRDRVDAARLSGRNETAELVCQDSIYSLIVAPTSDGAANIYGTDVTDLRQMQRSLRQYAGRLEALHEIDQAVLSAQSVEAIAKAALARVPKLLACARASLMLLDFDMSEISVLAAYGHQTQTTQGEGWRAHLTDEWDAMIDRLQRGQVLEIRDAYNEIPTALLEAAGHRAGAETLLAQPLRTQGKLLGVLLLGLRGAGAVAPLSLELAQELADELAIAIQQTRLNQQVQSYAQDLELRVARRTTALRISQARFRAIFEDAPLGIALLNQNGRILESNAALESLLGREAGALKGTPLHSYLGEGAMLPALPRLLAPETDVVARSHDEVRLRTVDEQEIWCNVTLAPIRTSAPQPKLAIAMVEDTTEQREAQAAMVQNEKLALTGQLAASLAHEINNPLQTVIGCLGLADESLEELSLADGASPASVRSYLAMASDELQRAAGIVGRLRDLSRRSTAEEKEARSPRQLVAHVLAISRKQCRDRGITINLIEGQVVPNVTVVADRIHQVLLNLVLNAVDAMPRGGELSVSIAGTRAPDGARITLHDTGRGIAPELQESLFEPFETTKPEGLGLGLYISRSIVQDHGGHIHVRSSPGEGTSFSVWLPA